MGVAGKGNEGATMTMSDLLEDPKRTKQPIDKMSPFSCYGGPFPFSQGLPVFEDPHLTELEEYVGTETFSFWQRGLEPISTFHNFQTMPFEPWVRTRTERKTRTVPSRKIFRTEYGLFIHPATKQYISSVLGPVS